MERTQTYLSVTRHIQLSVHIQKTQFVLCFWVAANVVKILVEL